MTENLKRILEKRINSQSTLLVPGAPNALAAKIIQDLGFDAVYLTVAGIANSYLGVPDIGLLTLTEIVNHAAAIRDAVNLFDMSEKYADVLSRAEVMDAVRGL